MTLLEELEEMARRLDEMRSGTAAEEIADVVSQLEDACAQFAKSFSGSWFGYHAYVYYKDFTAPPPGTRFSVEFGFREMVAIEGTEGDWAEYAPTYVREEVLRQAGVEDLKAMRKQAKKIREEIDRIKLSLLSILSQIIMQYPGDGFLATAPSKIEKLVIPNATQALEVMQASAPRFRRR